MSSPVENFIEIERTGGFRTAMRWLNERTPYRYTAIFAFDGDTLRNICLIDKEDPSVERCDDQPITESYCIFIHKSAERFGVEHALRDERVEGHPKQRSFQCYYGVPLLGPDGKLLGTVCHFDVEPIRVTEDVVMMLDDLAPIIADAAFRSREIS